MKSSDSKVTRQLFLCTATTAWDAVVAMAVLIFLGTALFVASVRIENTASSSIRPRNLSFLMEEMGTRYAACVVHFVHLTETVEFLGPPLFPIVLDLWTIDVESLAGSCYKGADSVQRIAIFEERRFKTKSMKMRHLSCFITLLFLAGLENPVVSDLFSQEDSSVVSPRRSEVFRILLQQDFSLGLEVPSGDRSAEEGQHVHAPIFFPESVILFCSKCNFTVNDLTGSYFMPDYKLFWKSTHLPNIILLMTSSFEAQPNDPNGLSDWAKCEAAFVYCWYCGERQQLLPVNCSSEIMLSWENKIWQLANQVPWLNVDGFSYSHQEYLFPFTLSSKKELRWNREADLIFAYTALQRHLNSSNIPRFDADGRLPQLHFDEQPHDYEFLAPAERMGFAVFTAEGAYRGSHATSAVYFPPAQPFCLVVWANIAVSSLVIALTMAKLHDLTGFKNIDVLGSFYSVIVIAVGQTQNFPLEQQRRSSGLSRMDGMLRWRILFIWSLWLLSTTFIVNDYSAVFNSNYMIEPVYTRNWTMGLQGMDNFTVFIGFDQPPLKTVRRRLAGGYYLTWYNCVSFEMFFADFHPRYPCAAVIIYKQMMLETFQRSNFSVLLEKSEALLDRIRLVPMALLEEIIPTRLADEKTLFISPTPFAHTDWSYFRRAMSLDKSLKFSKSLDSKGAEFEADSFCYGFTKGLNQLHKNTVPRRLKGVVSGGLLGLWRKWKNLRTQFSQVRMVNEGILWLPLSVWGSDLYYVFTLFAICVSCCIGAFGFEVGISLCTVI